MIKELLWMFRFYKRPLRRQIAIRREHLAAWLRFWRSLRFYKEIAPANSQPALEYLRPCLGDATTETPIEPTYFYQDTWAFEKIVSVRPAYHIDVGSHHKFVAFLSKVLPVTMVDLRPLSLQLDSLEFRKGSILNLPFESSSVPSVSSLCVIEHIGLGRYGDPIDPSGSEKAIQELKRIVEVKGNLYVSIALHDENRIFFNAHRAFKEEYLFELFEPFRVIESRYIYGRTFSMHRKTGFGVGCYHLRRA